MSLKQEKKEYGLPSSWVERIFARLQEIYGDKWPPQKDPNYISLMKTVWATSLANLSHLEIKRALDQCRINSNIVPDNIKFHQYAKGYSANLVAQSKDEKRQISDTAKQTLTTIRNNLHKKLYKDVGHVSEPPKNNQKA